MAQDDIKGRKGFAMNEEIGAYDARTKLPEILRRVEAGERFTITNRGKPVADLIPSRSADLPNLWHLEAGNVLLVVANGLAVTRFKTVKSD